MKIDENIKECPYCGCKTYYIKQHYFGDCHYHFSYNAQEQDSVDNGDMWETASFRNTSKYAWCSNCDKKLFKLDKEEFS